jgi:predicted MPP superfamily phosphohydrolase
MPAAAIALAALVGSVTASRVVSSRKGGLAVTRHRLPWNGTRPVRVVHLTDLHVGPTTPRSVLTRVARVVHSLESDVVVLTGDYVNMSLLFLDRVKELVESLPKPCVATLGNHDHWTSADRVASALRAGGADVLRNASTTLDGLAVVGVDDGCSGNADVDRAFARVAAPEQALVLSHFPNTARVIATKGAPLVLSGHTHAGQIDVPYATRTIARLTGNPYLHGFYRVGPKTELYVNAGIGHSLPGLRAGRTCPEIAVFELDPTLAARTSSVDRAPWSEPTPR